MLLKFLLTYEINIKFVHTCIGYNQKCQEKTNKLVTGCNRTSILTLKFGECENQDFYENICFSCFMIDDLISFVNPIMYYSIVKTCISPP